MLDIQNYRKTYPNGKVAVDGLSLRVESGDILGFIGHNGAGKTTTIRAAVGVLAFDEGEILIDGHSIRQEPIRCKQILAYIPDEPTLYNHMTGTKYLNFVADMYRVPEKDREERVHRYAEQLEFLDSLNGLISSYSHGMKQKLAIISALIHAPKLLVLDEPFVGLDPKASFTLKEIMKEHCEQGMAVFFSSHVLETVEKLCNKIAIIKNGKLVRSGETAQVRGDSSLEEVFLELTDDNTN
ncbi:MAG: ABC transporter ATP-binding protein [Firmicutes bacterium]|nr:ABC transporter ATP-binding protein [Bacillota bacterium]